MSRTAGTSELAVPALLGTAAGMRALTPGAVLGLVLGRRPLGALLLATGAAAELVYDKLPAAKSRTEPPSLAARTLAGATAGGIAARLLGTPVGAGALIGGGAAVLSTFVFHRLRGLLTRGSALPAAFAEDALALGLSGAATLRLR